MTSAVADGKYTIAMVEGDVTVAAAFEEDVVPGDVNGDRIVDMTDVAAIIDVMAGRADSYAKAADVNKDSAVNVADIIAVMKLVTGK